MPGARPTLSMTRAGAQWAAALGCSLAAALALDRLAVPAGFLVGPMATGMLFALRGATIGLPRSASQAGQALIGCSIARVITASVLTAVAQSWPAMLAAVLATVAASALVGWLLARFGSLPGTTAAWGTSPGAAAAMVAMAQEFGADPLAVAMMQYLRVVFVVLTALLVSELWLGSGHQAGAAAPAWSWPADLGLLSLAGTLAVAAVGAGLAVRLRVPAGALLVPMIAAALLQGAGWLTVTVPRAVLMIGYGAIGLSIGLRFRRELLRRTLRAIPEMLASAVALIGLCGVSAWVLVRVLHTDALTAYLATSPGGLDSVAAIAADSRADVPFVMALQTLRLVVVVLTGPLLARLLSKAAGPPERA